MNKKIIYLASLLKNSTILYHYRAKVQSTNMSPIYRQLTNVLSLLYTAKKLYNVFFTEKKNQIAPAQRELLTLGFLMAFSKSSISTKKIWPPTPTARGVG